MKFSEFEYKRIDFEDILTINDKMLNAINQAKVFAETDNPILICGETGTGKEMFAQAIINYAVSGRQKVIIHNCAAVPENLLEVILFGTTKALKTRKDFLKRLTAESFSWMSLMHCPSTFRASFFEFFRREPSVLSVPAGKSRLRSKSLLP